MTESMDGFRLPAAVARRLAMVCVCARAAGETRVPAQVP
jgi:hypothetical protein